MGKAGKSRVREGGKKKASPTLCLTCRQCGSGSRPTWMGHSNVPTRPFCLRAQHVQCASVCIYCMYVRAAASGNTALHIGVKRKKTRYLVGLMGQKRARFDRGIPIGMI